MAGVNKAILVGNVGRDPEIRTSQSGANIAQFSIATSKSWKDKVTGERKEQTDWHNVVVFNEHLVRIIEQYVHKGSKLYIEGEIRTRKYTNKDGIEVYRTEIVLSTPRSQLFTLDRREGSGGVPDEQAYSAAPRTQQRPETDDEIPF
jgi:single-strand DNA-binding protein